MWCCNCLALLPVFYPGLEISESVRQTKTKMETETETATERNSVAFLPVVVTSVIIGTAIMAALIGLFVYCSRNTQRVTQQTLRHTPPGLILLFNLDEQCRVAPHRNNFGFSLVVKVLSCMRMRLWMWPLQKVSIPLSSFDKLLWPLFTTLPTICQLYLTDGACLDNSLCQQFVDESLCTCK